MAQATPGIGKTRYEVKMVADQVFLPEVRSWVRLHPLGLRIHHPPQDINNVYLDTGDLDNYWDNKAGIQQRQKVRLRWYGESTHLVANPVLEVKRKHGPHGWKLSQKLQVSLNFATQGWSGILQSIQRAADGSLREWLDWYNQPTLINRYRREYYITGDGRIRVTLDYNQMNYDQQLNSRPNLRYANVSPGTVVIEAKALEGDRDYLQSILAEAPLRICANSKYVHGIESAVL